MMMFWWAKRSAFAHPIELCNGLILTNRLILGSVTIDVLRPLQITPNVRNIPTNNKGYFRFKVVVVNGRWKIIKF